ncbi:MAG: esterase, partial [Gemmatimonadota bacterium]|nr:esterase [Gemmatimonadota bacterium]
HHRWYSPSLGRHMDLLVFGHAGARMLVYPSSMGKFFEWEDRGMVDALGEHLSRGWLQMFCVDSVDEESWYAKWKHPAERAWRQTQYENYVLHEVLPLSWDINPH